MQQAADVSELCPERGFGLSPAASETCSQSCVWSPVQKVPTFWEPGASPRVPRLKKRRSVPCGVTGGDTLPPPTHPRHHAGVLGRTLGWWHWDGKRGRSRCKATLDPQGWGCGWQPGSGSGPPRGDLWLGASILPGVGSQQGCQHR